MLPYTEGREEDERVRKRELTRTTFKNNILTTQGGGRAGRIASNLELNSTLNRFPCLNGYSSSSFETVLCEMLELPNRLNVLTPLGTGFSLRKRCINRN